MLHILDTYWISLRKKIEIFFSNSQTSQIWSKNPTVGGRGPVSPNDTWLRGSKIGL